MHRLLQRRQPWLRGREEGSVCPLTPPLSTLILHLDPSFLLSVLFYQFSLLFVMSGYIFTISPSFLPPLPPLSRSLSLSLALYLYISLSLSLSLSLSPSLSLSLSLPPLSLSPSLPLPQTWTTPLAHSLAVKERASTLRTETPLAWTTQNQTG